MSMMNQIARTIPERLNDHEVRLRALESGAHAPTKPWWLSKGVTSVVHTIPEYRRRASQ